MERNRRIDCDGTINVACNERDRAGQRKIKVHDLFKREGDEAAWVLGLKLGLKEGTLHIWFAQWRRCG